MRQRRKISVVLSLSLSCGSAPVTIFGVARIEKFPRGSYHPRTRSHISTRETAGGQPKPLCLGYGDTINTMHLGADWSDWRNWRRRARFLRVGLQPLAALRPLPIRSSEQAVTANWIGTLQLIAIVALTAISGYLFFQLHQRDIVIADLKQTIGKRDQKILALLAEAQSKASLEAEAQAARARSTPTQFGAYLTQGDSPLQPLEPLSEEKRDLPLDLPKYLDKPQVVVQKRLPVHIVLYDRVFSLAAPSKLMVHIVAKVRNEDAWVVRNRGYEFRVFPRLDNRDILDVFSSYDPGRYAIEFEGKYYAFTVEGVSEDPEFCVEKRRGVFLNDYVVCRRDKGRSHARQ